MGGKDKGGSLAAKCFYESGKLKRLYCFTGICFGRINFLKI